MSRQLDLMDAQQLLGTAYELNEEFERVINDQLEGDHQYASVVTDWLNRMDKLDHKEK